MSNFGQNKQPRKKILLSGVKPTGRPHIGNYFGAMKQFVDLQNDPRFAGKKAEKFFMIADYHGLNFIQNATEMRQNILDLAIDYLAIGIDPSQSVIFKQSDVSAHTELAWIFDTITTMPYLMRAHAYKDAEAKNKEISVGAFNYPVLMAADILLYDTDIVPVGQDQKQHVEYARDIAQKFNNTFGTKGAVDAAGDANSAQIFKLPDVLMMKDVATVAGIDGQKMSKSYSNTIPLFSTYEEIQKAVMSIVTDSGTAPDGSPSIPINVYNIHKLFRTEVELAPLYEANKGKYKILKEALIADIETFTKPLREQRAKIAANPKKVIKILVAGAKQARKRAAEKMEIVKTSVGVHL